MQIQHFLRTEFSMGTLASNLLMCTCAGAIGVAAVAVAKKVNHAVARKPAVARTVDRTASPQPVQVAKAADCQPLGISMAALAPIASEAAPEQPDLPDLTGFAAGAGQQMASILPPPGTSGNMAATGLRSPPAACPQASSRQVLHQAAHQALVMSSSKILTSPIPAQPFRSRGCGSSWSAASGLSVSPCARAATRSLQTPDTPQEKAISSISICACG